MEEKFLKIIEIIFRIFHGKLNRIKMLYYKPEIFVCNFNKNEIDFIVIGSDDGFC